QLIYPHSTIVSEHIVLPINKNIKAKQKDLISSFIQFLWSKEVQQLLEDFHFYSVDEVVTQSQPGLDNIADSFTLDSLGGARVAKIDIVEKLTQNLIVPVHPDRSVH
ncbi:unnamed protein product, partial [marine sediment metagenome]